MWKIRAAACAAVVGLGLCAAGAEAAEPHRFCGGERQAMLPADLENVAGDLTLEYIAQQPASMLFCSYGYWAEKCGDHETANAIYDRCIAAGYAGAMIWKALLYEDGKGVPHDPARATALLRQAATSGDSGYATLGKLHYASALHLGKGVERNEAEARKWFQAAADEGNPEAQDFLRTGHHTGERDERGNGVGPIAQPLQGQKLEKVLPAAIPAPSWREGLAAALLALVFAAGMLRQGRAPAARRPDFIPPGVL